MRAGESVKCPHCGERTIVKSKMRTEGFSIVGESLFCILCNAELESEKEEVSSSEPTSGAANKLSALLGDVSIETGADLTPDEEYGRFCRNCTRFIEHPFHTLCGLDGSVADPMSECAQFEQKES